jgi:hypothetical protein
MKDEAGLIHSSEAEELEEKEVVVAKNQKTKTGWGPIQRIPRPRRVLDDGKTELQRAQELKKVINLEKGRGPIQRIPRPRRVLDDGKTVLQRAQELKKVRNLEKGSKYSSSFAFASNTSLNDKACTVGIELGMDDPSKK